MLKRRLQYGQLLVQERKCCLSFLPLVFHILCDIFTRNLVDNLCNFYVVLTFKRN